MTNKPVVPFSHNVMPNGDESIVFFGSRGPRMVPQSHASFNRIKNALMGDRPQPEEYLYRQADAATVIEAKLRKLSERVSLKGDTVYFDGDAMESLLTRHVVQMVKDGDGNFGGYVKLLEAIQSNPTERGRAGFFEFVEKNGLPVTPRGTVIGYKSVGADGLSITAGSQDVTVTLPDGEPEVHRGRIPNPVGATVEMARSLVDDDRNNACSVGLHVGTYGYATSFGGSPKFMTVEFSPRDVVETPHGDATKVRVCRYTVIEHNENREHYQGTSFGVADYPDDDEFDDVDDWADDEFGDDEPDDEPQPEPESRPEPDDLDPDGIDPDGAIRRTVRYFFGF